MSIKYLQDQQLNQVQQSPNNSPWAKLIAQSEMLERNRMRQPQGQAPQGTVAGNIQQQLIDAQMKQESETQNADLYKSQMLAQLIGSGQIPANFSAQGYADGGLAQPQAGTGAYRGIMMPSQGAGANPSYAPKQPTLSYIPPSSQDPAAQEKKHGMLQTLLDNSMYSGKGTIDSNMQMYSDMLTGKLFGRGFAEGGDIRGFAGGGGLEKFLNRYPSHPSTTGIKPYLQAPTGVQYQDVPELQKVLGEAKTNNELAELLRQDPSALDKIKAYFGKQPKGLPYIPQISESPELQEYYKNLYEPKTRGDVYNSLAQQANAPAPTDAGVEQMKIPPRGSMPSQEQPNVGPRVDPTAEFKSRMYGEQSGVSPARSNLMGTLFNVAEQKEAVNPARSNLMGTLLNVAEQKEALANQPAPAMTERLREAGMAGYNDKTILDTMANKMSATDRINAANKPDIPVEPAPADAWSGAEAGKGLGEELKGVGQGIAGLFKGPVGVAGKALRAVAPVGDLMAVHDVTGSPLPMLAKAAGVNVPSSIGGVPVSQGGPSQLAMDLMGSPTARLNQVGSGISDAAQYVGDKATSAYDQFKNRLNAPPSVPQTDISQFGVDTKAAIPQQPTIGDFSGSATPQAQTPQQGVRKREDGVIVNSKSAGKAPDTKQNGQVTSDAHGYGTPNSVDSHPAGNPINALLTTTQATQAADKTSDTGMGQGSILDSLYSKLKDTDVDYSDLAKRISENEYDLARERKDGTFNAILGGVGAALSKAGSYEGAGDRVFRPGYGAIAGAGITGGLKMANESNAAIAKKSQDNTVSMLALKKLKGDSLNNVLDAISAQKQNEVYARSVAQSGAHNIATTALEDKKLAQQAPLVAAQIEQYAANANHLNATAQQLLANKTMSDADKENLKTMLSQYNTLVDARKKEAANIGATPENIKYYDDRIGPLEAALGRFTGVDLSKVGAGGSGVKTREQWEQEGFIKR